MRWIGRCTRAGWKVRPAILSHQKLRRSHLAYVLWYIVESGAMETCLGYVYGMLRNQKIIHARHGYVLWYVVES